MSEKEAHLLFNPMSDGALLRMRPGEKLYRLYFFRPAAGRHVHLEHRVLAKQREDGLLEMISYTVQLSPEGRLERSNVLRVPEISPEDLERVVDRILEETHTNPENPGEFEEIDLTYFDTLEEQLDYLSDYGLIDDEGADSA